MCVTVGMKLPRDRKTGKPTKDAKWRLAKIRDRVYSPEYSVRRYTVKDIGASQLFLIDKDTDWSEGISVHENGSFLSMVNSALNNSSDKKDGKGKGKGKPGGDVVSLNGRVIRSALKSHNIEDAVKILIENKIDGCSLITDGNRLFIIETTLPLEVKEKYRLDKGDKKFEDVVPLDEYKTVVREIKDDYLAVRTNHGVFDETFGYQKKDGDSYISSTKRREYALKILEESVYEPIDLITTLSRMGRDDIDDNAFYRPVRLFGQAKSKDSDVEIYSTSIIQTDPSGTMILKPLECTININNITNLISKDYLAHLVILPQHSSMFEHFKEYNKIREINKILL